MKLPHEVHCDYEVADRLRVETSEEAKVRLEARGDYDRYVSVYLTPEKARRLAKAIKRAAKKAEANQ